MNPTRRTVLGTLLLGSGYAIDQGLGQLVQTERPDLKKSLQELPMSLGDWVGHDVPVDSRIAKESQASEYINRVYSNRSIPGSEVWLWINYSKLGLNLRHSPEICLPSGGWTKVESATKVVEVNGPSGPQSISMLGYRKGELLQRIGFWYYIFGEGQLEQFVRSLPITSRSSHGRTTRGSGLTVEVFFPGDTGINDSLFQQFVSQVLVGLEPSLPSNRASYFRP